MTPLSRYLVCRRLLGSLFLAVLAVFAVMAYSSSAKAQQRTFYLDRLQIGGSPNDGFAVWRPRMKEETVFFGQFALGYQLKPLRGPVVAYDLRRESETPDPVKNQLTAYMTAGIELLQRASIAVTLPVVLFQNGSSPCGGALGCSDVDINPTVPSDTRIDGRFIAYRDQKEKFHLGLAATAWVPSGDEISFTTDAQTHAAIQALAELDFKKFALTLNTGVHFRPERGVNRLRVGNEWTWALGGFIPLRDGKIRLGAQLYGSTGLGEAGDPVTSTPVEDKSTTFTGRNTPLEWLGEIRFALDKEKAGWAAFGAGTRLSGGYGAPNLRVLATIGYAFSLQDTDPNAPGKRYVADDAEPSYGDRDKDGIPDDLDLCPTIPEDGEEPDPSDGCPAAPDRDHDGIPDDTDKCPDDPEDKDGIDDLDGCPEDDFDADGVPDVEDKCPREPGQPSAEPDKNGCPKFIRRIEGSTEIQILKKVEFDTNRATIKARSFPILDEVVALLKANKDIVKVLVEGHTDSRGTRELNTRLSKNRAGSVKTYLINKGVQAGRLESQGFGPDRPVDTNDTDEGRQRNRRVQFKILEQN